MDLESETGKFLNVLLEKYVPGGRPLTDKNVLADAVEQWTLDALFYSSKTTNEDLWRGLTVVGDEIPVFLYRVVRAMYCADYPEDSLYKISWLMKTLSAVEIYWNTEIGTGFKVWHGLGTVIGSRIKVGQGFQIHHGCTVGHRDMSVGVRGPEIGDNVILYANSEILGSIFVGSNVTIGCNLTIQSDLPSDSRVFRPSIRTYDEKLNSKSYEP